MTKKRHCRYSSIAKKVNWFVWCIPNGRFSSGQTDIFRSRYRFGEIPTKIQILLSKRNAKDENKIVNQNFRCFGVAISALSNWTASIGHFLFVRIFALLSRFPPHSHFDTDIKTIFCKSHANNTQLQQSRTTHQKQSLNIIKTNTISDVPFDILAKNLDINQTQIPIIVLLCPTTFFHPTCTERRKYSNADEFV